MSLPVRAGGYTDVEIEALRQKLLQPDPGISVTTEYRMLRTMRSLYSDAASRLGGRFPASSMRKAADAPNMITSDPISVDITVRNPQSTAKTVKLIVRSIDLPLEWSASVDKASVLLEGGASTPVRLTVYPTGAAIEESQFRVAVEGYIDGAYIGGVLTKVVVPKYLASVTYRSFVPITARAGVLAQ